MANPVTSKTYSNLTSRDADKIYLEKYTETPSEFNKVTKKMDMKFGDFVEKNFAGMGYMQENYEGATFIMDNITQGNTKRVYPTTRVLGFEVTEEAEMDDMYGIIKQLPAELAKSVAATDEVIGFLPYNQAFAGPRVGLDGQYLCSASHPDLVNGTTQSNLATGALGADTLQDALILSNNVKLSTGRPTNVRATSLIVAANSANYFIAKDLLKNDYLYNSANRNLNPIMGEGLQLKPVHWLTTSTNWFLISDTDHGIYVYTRMDNTRRSDTEGRTGNFYMYVKHRKTADFFNWQGVVGSTGA